MIKEVSRRSFLKGAALGAAGVAAMGTLGVAGAAEAEAADMNAEKQKWAFEIPPAAITDVAETVENELVVVGAGMSGLVVALAAAEEGVKVTLISASDGPVARGGSVHATNSRVLEAAGQQPYDLDYIWKKELVNNMSCALDMRKWYKLYDNSEASMNWLLDRCEEGGITAVIEMNTPRYGEDSPFYTPPVSHSFLSPGVTRSGIGQPAVVAHLSGLIASYEGCEVIYGTRAEQLVRGGVANGTEGRVEGVIALSPAGKHILYQGTKAVVLATGDFSADREMMSKYCSWALPLVTVPEEREINYDIGLMIGGLYRGDGHKMALWCGAAWQRVQPNCGMVLGGQVGAQPYSFHHGLVVNKHGVRFCNEDMPFAPGCRQIMMQPDMFAAAIWSEDYAETGAPWYIQGDYAFTDPVSAERMIESWEMNAKFATLEEAINHLGLPMEQTLETIRKYNEYCDAGYDPEFHKQAKELCKINMDGPFYAGIAGPALLTVLGGPRTNENMQICDDNDEPIPGLYAAGTMVGDMYANMYTFYLEGINYGGVCTTLGYVTGKYIAANE